MFSFQYVYVYVCMQACMLVCVCATRDIESGRRHFVREKYGMTEEAAERCIGNGELTPPATTFVPGHYNISHHSQEPEYFKPAHAPMLARALKGAQKDLSMNKDINTHHAH